MKRSRVIFGIVSIAGLAVVGCKKPDPNTPPAVGEATISGIIWANTDASNDTDAFGTYTYGSVPEFPITGTTITFVINEQELDYNPDAGFTYQNIFVTTDVDPATGNYSVTVPAINRPLDVDIYFDDFMADQNGYDPFNTDSNFTNNDTEFSLASFNVGGIIAGGNYIVNATYAP